MRIGDRANMLTYIEYIGRIEYGKQGQKSTKGLFKCDCGNERIIPIANVKRGHTRSCGCALTESLIGRNTSHGLSQHKLYNVRLSIINRCSDKKNTRYANYGGRGITICDEWLADFMSFYNWAIENGYKNGLQIDRIDNDGNYEPLNCRWVSQKENLAVGRQSQKVSNTSGFNGVCKTGQKWVAYMTSEGKRYNLGQYTNVEDAVRARIDKEIELHGKQKTNLHYRKMGAQQ